jgi:hypothetical protein
MSGPEVLKLDIGHDGAWPGAAWHLNKVMVQNLASQATMFFHCNRWLDSKAGKRAVLEAGRPEDAEHQYQVSHPSSRTPSRNTSVGLFQTRSLRPVGQRARAIPKHYPYRSF